VASLGRRRLADLRVVADRGDLRVAHFLGMHALHVLPVIGLTAARLLPSHLTVPAVCVAALAYCGLTAITFMQAPACVPVIPA
jgi:hypothetical protein